MNPRYKIDWRVSINNSFPYGVYREERGWFGHSRWTQIDIFSTLEDAQKALSRLVKERLPIYSDDLAPGDWT